MFQQTGRLTCAQINEWDMVAYLLYIGYEPKKIRGNDYWYLSPLRGEKTASFKVNRKRNVWYDHGTGEGGTLVDFAVLYYNCTVAELIERLSLYSSFQKPVSGELVIDATIQQKLTLQKVFPLTSYALIKYLHDRRIPLSIAEKYCKEVKYSRGNKTYYGIGFANDAGGYEIRNPYFKGSLSPKAITMIPNESKSIAVFEGFIDFLSYLVIAEKSGLLPSNLLILNSLAFASSIASQLDEFEEVNLFLDNDLAGQNCSRNFLSRSKKYIDRSSLYNRYKDLDEWLMHPGMPGNSS